MKNFKRITYSWLQSCCIVTKDKKGTIINVPKDFIFQDYKQKLNSTLCSPTTLITYEL